MLRITADPRYGDSMEQVFFNTVLGARPLEPDGRRSTTPTTHSRRAVLPPAKWPCCSGTLPQIAADYRISAYFRSERGVYVNLYLPSTLRWNARGAQFALRQTTAYPYDEQFALRRYRVVARRVLGFPAHSCVGPGRIAYRERHARLAQSSKQEPSLKIRRQWKNGDRIELDLPFTTRLEAVDAQHPDVMALSDGPAGAHGDAQRRREARARRARHASLRANKLPAQGHEWIAGSGPTALRMRPFVDIGNEGYTTYLKVVEA